MIISNLAGGKTVKWNQLKLRPSQLVTKRSCMFSLWWSSSFRSPDTAAPYTFTRVRVMNLCQGFDPQISGCYFLKRDSSQALVKLGSVLIKVIPLDCKL